MANKLAQVTGSKTGLGDKKEDGAKTGSKVLQKMGDDKQAFIKEFAMKRKISDKEFDDAIWGDKGKGEKIPGTVTLPSKKREADEDTESLLDSTQNSKKKSNKKQKK